MKRLALALMFLLSACRGSQAPDSVRVALTNPLPEAAQRETVSLISNSEAVKTLYEATLALPAPPEKLDPYCLIGDGISYHLQFLKGKRVLLEADAQEHGCELVKLSDGRTLSADGEPGGKGFAFWRALKSGK